MMIVKIIGILLSLVIGIQAYRGEFFMPMGIRHLYHQIINPNDLYEPIVLDYFPIDKKEFSKKYALKPKYFDYYDIGLLNENGKISSKYKFDGDLLVEFFWKNKILFKKNITSIKSAIYFDKELKNYKKISLAHFEIPLNKKYTKDISVKITVIKEDKKLKNLGEMLKLYIVVNSSP